MDDHESRGDLMEASLFAGLAISQTRTALCHSMSYPITARFGVPHGIACSVWMPGVLELNAKSDDGRLQRVASSLGFDSPKQLSRGIEKLLRELGAWEIFDRGVRDLGELLPYVDEMITPGRSDNNLRAAGIDEIAAIIEAA